METFRLNMIKYLPSTVLRIYTMANPMCGRSSSLTASQTLWFCALKTGLDILTYNVPHFTHIASLHDHSMIRDQ